LTTSVKTAKRPQAPSDAT